MFECPSGQYSLQFIPPIRLSPTTECLPDLSAMNLTPSHKNSKYASFFLYGKETLVTIAIVILPMIFPETAHASLFSFLSSLVGENVSAQETIATGTSYNSQTLPLLELTPTDALAIADNTLVPFVGPSGSTADIDNQPGSTAISTYVVQSGDTLSEIAVMFDVSVNTIVWANSLGTHPVIQPGETLVILPVSGINYTVKKGDTLASIVKKYGGDVTEVMEYNGLSTDASIAIGDTIMIPDGELGGSSGSASETPTNFSNGTSPLIPGSSGPAIPADIMLVRCMVHGCPKAFMDTMQSI